MNAIVKREDILSSIDRAMALDPNLESAILSTAQALGISPETVEDALQPSDEDSTEEALNDSRA